ncbi:unnamed protein product [Pieris brassicae]|uniref:G-protein coupled receptors family 2 profile 2 domain-containing protein n=1 Tax=Pieris brassicae TaxID=7116 RepID=A0A9P0T0M4_PIEBR|nr:unnamed protein product [Pieris brassicae]
MLPLLLMCLFVSEISGTINNSDIGRYDTLTLRKCCEKNEVLVKITEYDLFLLDHYKCMDSNYVMNLYNVSAIPLLMNVSIRVQSGLPLFCDDIQVNQINSAETQLMVSEDKCYDKLEAEVVNGTIKENIPQTVALTCNITEESTKNLPSELKINEFKKCCPEGQAYDTEYHVCRISNLVSDDEWFVKALNITGNYIYDVGIGMHCKFDEYAVELPESLYSFSIDGNNLQLKNKEGDQEKTLFQGEWCIERQYAGKGLLVRTCTRNCSAFEAYCVRKCCPQGEHFKVRRCGSYISVCVPDEDNSTLFDLSTYTNPLREENKDLFDIMGVRVGLQCSAGRFALNKSLFQDNHHLTPQGNLQSGWTLTNNYCLEIFDSRHCPSEEITISGVLCFQPAPESQQDKDFRISFVIITISSVCLALTLIVYCALPELRNLNGLNLICHVTMMLLAFACLARVQYSAVDDVQTCTMLGYGIYFGFVAAFAWLNVMCFDIWWTFGSVRTVKLLRKSASERRRFILYSVYAWSTTIVLTLTMFLLDHYPISLYLDANIGTGSCWFSAVQNTITDWPHYIFFVIPMGLVTCTNFILWLLTARYCAKVKSEVHRLQAGSVGDRAKKRFRIDRTKYILTGKLWVVMGAGWISELLSTIVVSPSWLWDIVDLINGLQGVLIFLILVVKPKLYHIIRRRLGSSKRPGQKDTRLDKGDAQNATASGRTSSTFLSRTISSDERTNLRISGLQAAKQA